MNDIKDSRFGDGILKEFLNSTLRDMMSVVNAECGSLFLFDSGEKELILKTFHNSGDLCLSGLRKKIGEGIAGKVADMRKPILVKDISGDLRFRQNGFKHYKTNSFISIPLFSSEGLLGLINLTDKSSGEPFSERDLESAVTVSRYICLAIDNFCNFMGLTHEKEAVDRQKSVLEKYASVGKLSASIVHEINNPLDGIIRYTNILLNQADNNSVVREYLLEVKKGLNRIANITRSLLDFSRQINFSYNQNKKYVDIHQLIDESLEVLGDRLNGKIRIEKKYKDNLPEILDLGLSQVIVNIIRNALDAMPEGGRLDITTDIKDSVVSIIFEDNGMGIAPQVKARLFEPFFTTKSVDNGTGLGLAISKEIIDKYGGNIEVESFPAKGSTFRILIPKKYLENA